MKDTEKNLNDEVPLEENDVLLKINRPVPIQQYSLTKTCCRCDK